MLPGCRLVIRNRLGDARIGGRCGSRTNASLWAFTEQARWAVLEGSGDKNFNGESARIVSDVQGPEARSAAAG